MLTSLATPFIFLGSLALNPFSTSDSAPPPSVSCADIFILHSGIVGGTSVLRNTLRVLDVVDIADNHVPSPPFKTYQEIPGNARYQDILTRCPDAKFIFATEKSEIIDVSHGGSELLASNLTCHPQFPGIDRSKVLEIEIGGVEKHAGETWEKLCRFLGLGYSVLERKGLRKFPGEMGGREELRRGLGGRFSYGYAGIGETEMV